MEVEAEVEDDDGFAKGTPVHYPNYGSTRYSSDICDVCLLPSHPSNFVTFNECGHTFCSECVKTTFEAHIRNGKSCLKCLQCPKEASPQIVRDNLSPGSYHRYLEFTLRGYLVLQSNVRQCLAPDCSFAYIIDNPSTCEDSHFVCGREGCRGEYCSSCKGEWHEGLSCKKARKLRKKDKNGPIADVLGKEVLKDINVKLCPRCGTGVEKIEDGGCNHVVCHICRLEFCWLCLRPGSELHYLSPTGCPMYGQRRWSWWKTWILRICLWIGAPLISFLLAIVLFFVSLFLLPILITYLIYSALKEKAPICPLVTISIIVTVLGYFISPILSLLVALLVLPLALVYFYCFIPFHLIATSIPPRRQTVPADIDV